MSTNNARERFNRFLSNFTNSDILITKDTERLSLDDRITFADYRFLKKELKKNQN